jgi:hypothetical protein
MVSFTVVADKYYTAFVGGRSHQASPKDMPSSEAFQTWGDNSHSAKGFGGQSQGGGGAGEF